MKTICSLKEVFTDLLDQSEKNHFMIPAYQRGYKWTSVGENSQVETLMRDLFSAFDKNRNRYYLQFLTLKVNDTYLEVIDGQQRLTTLTILFSVLNSFRELEGEELFVTNKLSYQVRENFIKSFIYKDINCLLAFGTWESFLTNNSHAETDINNQDVYFIYNAAQAINRFITNKIELSRRKAFYNYLSNKVYLIINPLDGDINSEKVFINVNKGVKLKDEDLVKGLLITKIPLDFNDQYYRLTDIEVNELRSKIGSQWDELSHWTSRSDIQNFFKTHSSESRLGWLIKLTYPEAAKHDGIYPLFTYLDHLYRIDKVSAGDIFKALRSTMYILNDWYLEKEIANLLGYILHARESYSIYSLWGQLSSLKTKQEVLKALKATVKSMLPLNGSTGKLAELNYEDHKKDLFNLFLLLDVAKVFLNGKPGSSSYDFSKIAYENWSIEHIFPQNAKDFKSLDSLSVDDLAMIKQLLPASFKDLMLDTDEMKDVALLLYQRIQSSDNECPMSNDDRVTLEYLLKRSTGSLHNLGNLALLQQSINSGLSNHYFDSKRKILVRKISTGEFVPFHTYDVFSKLVIETQTSLHIWSKQDIERHEQYIIKQVDQISNYLTH